MPNTEPRGEGIPNENKGIVVSPEVVAKFWMRVRKGSLSGNGCWQWMGSIQNRGFGVFHLGHGKKISANRFSWELENGPAGEDVLVHHRKRCNNRGCVRPDHQERISRQAAGKRRGLADAVKTFQELTDPAWSLQRPSEITRDPTHSGSESQYSVLIDHSKILVRAMKTILLDQKKMMKEMRDLSAAVGGDLRAEDDQENDDSVVVPGYAWGEVMAVSVDDLGDAVEGEVIAEVDVGGEGEVSVDAAPDQDFEQAVDDQLWRLFTEAIPSATRKPGHSNLARSLDIALMSSGGDATLGLKTFKVWIKDFAELVDAGAKSSSTSSFERNCELLSKTESQLIPDACPAPQASRSLKAE